MATVCLFRRSAPLISPLHHSPCLLRRRNTKQYQGFLQTSTPPINDQPKPPSFAFAFDIDGVLLRSSKPLPRAHRALTFLQSRRIPFILLTNGGGKSEQARIKELSQRLEVPLEEPLLVQSHTPFAELTRGARPPLCGKTVLVAGGEGDKCRRVAEGYGFTTVITPSDIITALPALWPFTSPHPHALNAQPLPSLPLTTATSTYQHDPTTPPVKIDAILIFNDPRDWALDIQLTLDLLLSHHGNLGTVSAKNGNEDLPNRGYLQDGQPELYFSNPDLLWASEYHLPRLGQGGFREALEGVWKAVTGGAKLEKKMFGKPTEGTFQFAEERLRQHRDALLAEVEEGNLNKEAAEERKKAGGLKTVYMVGDNPESDIRGANEYQSPTGSEWHSILVRSGVYIGGDAPAYEPRVIVDDVWDAVKWAMECEDMSLEQDEGQG